MGKTIYTIFLLMISAIVFGQGFKGIVLDKDTQEPLFNAQIYFVDLKTGTTTDENGEFKIQYINQRRIRIQLSYISYLTIDEILDLEALDEKVFYLEKSHFDLEEIVVSSPAGRLQGENIVSIEHQRIKDLQQSTPLTLAEAISNIQGVDQTTTGTGIGKPVIRGLSGNRIVTYAQGIRIENQQWGDEHGLGVGDIGIESVEVIKGPSSLLYGSDALGGVLYFIDERYALQNSVEGFVQSKFLSNSLGSINNAGIKYHKAKLKFNLFGTYASQADYKTPLSNRVFNTRFDEKNIKGSIGFDSKNWISNIRYSYLQNNYGIVEEAEYSNSSDRDFMVPFQSIDNHNISVENILFSGESKMSLTLGYTNNYRKEFEDDATEHALGLKLNTFSYNFKWHSPIYNEQFDFIVGVQGISQDNKNNGEEILIPDAQTNDIGAFAIANAKFDRFQLQGGLRIDRRQIETEQTITDEVNFPALDQTYNGVTFSSGAVYKLNKTKLRANISSGFRAPTTSELLSNGVHHGTNQYIRGSALLKNENATQLDFTLEYTDEHFSFSINPFFNTIGNYIYLTPTGEIIDGSPAFDYVQLDAHLYGGEIGLHYHPHDIHWLHLESNLSTVIAEDKNNNALPLIPQTRLNSTIRAEINNEGAFQFKNIFLQHNYKFQQNRIGLFETPTDGYHLLNLGLNMELSTKNQPIEISAGVKNLFNTRFIDHLSRFKSLDIANSGINCYIGVKFPFNKKLAE